MTMRVDANRATAGFVLKPKGVRFSCQQIVNEFLEKETACRDVVGVVDFQLAVIFDKHRPARGFEEQDWRARELMGAWGAVARRRLESWSAFAKATADEELRDVVFGEFCRGIEISLAKCRSSTAAPVLNEQDFESEHFEHFHR